MIARTSALLLLVSPLHAGPLIVAHRGASADAPENTLPAFKLAWKQGADAIEGDFHLTADGQIVCIHDADTEKVAGRKLVVKDATLGQLRALDVGRWKDPRWKGTTIPTLGEVMDTVPEDRTFFLEVKCGPAIVPILVRQLRASGLKARQVTIISFDQDVIGAMKQAAPEHEANWLCALKKKQGRTRPSRDAIIKTLRTCKADGLGTNAWPGIDRAFVEQVRATGCNYHVWTIDDAPTARRFLALGATSITTNRPGALRKELRK